VAATLKAASIGIPFEIEDCWRGMQPRSRGLDYMSLGELMELGAVQETVDAVISERALEGKNRAADPAAGAEPGDVVAGT
jgi:hypothetical protein